jgi:hypothetical protein
MNNLHSFSLTVANKYGDIPAIIFGYLSFKIHQSKHNYEGRQWYFETLNDIAKRYPYLRRATIHQAIQKLTAKNGLLITGDFNKKRYDRTKWYAFKDKEASKLASRNKVWFDIDDAFYLDITKAVLINLLAYTITEKRKDDPNYNAHPLSATELASFLPYGKSTIKRKLKALVDSDFVFEPATYIDHWTPTSFKFSECWKSEKLEKNANVSNCKSTVEQAQSHICNMVGSNLDMVGSNLDMVGSNLDDYTYYKTLLRNPLKETVRHPECSPPSHSGTFTQSSPLPKSRKDYNGIMEDFAVYMSRPAKADNKANQFISKVNKLSPADDKANQFISKVNKLSPADDKANQFISKVKLSPADDKANQFISKVKQFHSSNLDYGIQVNGTSFKMASELFNTETTLDADTCLTSSKHLVLLHWMPSVSLPKMITAIL